MNPGDWVVYRKLKYSTSPGPRARDVVAAPRGESYSYAVDKFWVVKDLLDDGQVVLVTRSGKEHAVSPSDPLLRHAAWWERWMYGRRYRETERLLAAE